MLHKFLGVEREELDKMANIWTEYKRQLTWISKPRNTEEEIKEFYVNMPVEYLVNLYLIAQKSKEKYLNCLKGMDLEGKRVLDFGTGAGCYGTELLSKGAYVDFYDVGKHKGLDYIQWNCEQNQTPNTRYNVLTDVSQLQNEYDIIICIDVFEHVKKSAEMFHFLDRKLAPFGSLIADSPLLYPLQHKAEEKELEILMEDEHLKEAAKSWQKEHVNDYIREHYNQTEFFHYFKTDNVILSMFNVLPQYPYTTGIYIEKALQRYGKVVPMRNLTNAVNGDGVLEIVEKYKVNIIFQTDSCGWVKLPSKGLENVLKVAYSIDTFINTPFQYEKLKPYDLVFYAQRKFVKNDGKSYWLPLGVDTDVYKPKNTEKKYDVAFCGTILDSKLHKERNEFIRQVVKYTNCYLGRDCEEYANLRYNEASIVFNAGIQNDLNMRVFEGMASGAVLLTNETDGQDEFFKHGEECLIYKDKDDLLNILTEYLVGNKRNELTKISERALAKIKNHTYHKRIETAFQIINEKLRK